MFSCPKSMPKLFISNFQFFSNAGFTSTCRCYWFMHCCRERGDIEAAVEGERTGPDGGGKRKKNGGYSASFTDILGLCGEDWRLILIAFANLLLAALSQVRKRLVGVPKPAPYSVRHLVFFFWYLVKGYTFFGLSVLLSVVPRFL